MATGLEKIVERVEELFLSALLPREEMDVVDQQGVDITIILTELGQFVLTDRVDKFIGEFLGRDISDARLGIVHQHLVRHRMHEVRFAKPCLSKNK